MEWTGNGATQDDLMKTDECIVLNDNDKIVGHRSKYDCHRFEKGSPRGILHRAFSVFLFNSEDRLLLQKRAGCKITFPDVWTNTCCSHPLFSFSKTEVDLDLDMDGGKLMAPAGIAHAAIRKLEHELGITKEVFYKDLHPCMEGQPFRFLTRVHYYAADCITHGQTAEWGEHEIDYILFVKMKDKEIPCKLNLEEVDDAKYVSHKELLEMMDEPGLLWSPWFQIIVRKFMPDWWKNVEETITTTKFVDKQTIYRFDPPATFRAGGGVAIPSTEHAKMEKKQGGYGKIPIISESKISQFLRLGEVWAALYYKSFASLRLNLVLSTEEEMFCNDVLESVSRSFAAVIRQLPAKLCIDVIVFYLVLRGLDTIEDDMEAFANDTKQKIAELKSFHQDALLNVEYSRDGVGLGKERELLQDFGKVAMVFQNLPSDSQIVIKDICRRMGEGMAEFVDADFGQGTTSIQQYNLYCHYVAGLVGEGLTRLFVANGFQSPEILEDKSLPNRMGLFLQKCNIIRDYLEDYVDGRAFWPQEVWKKYSQLGVLGEFVLPEKHPQALACLNHLITDALENVPDCLKYMGMLETFEVFRFCAIPQVMAMATLAKIYNNRDVFRGVVKIRKGLTCQLILDSISLQGVHAWFNHFAFDIYNKVPSNDPNEKWTKEICSKIMSLTNERANRHTTNTLMYRASLMSPFFIVLAFFNLRNQDMYQVYMAQRDLSAAISVSTGESLLFITLMVLNLLLFMKGIIDTVKPYDTVNFRK